MSCKPLLFFFFNYFTCISSYFRWSGVLALDSKFSSRAEQCKAEEHAQFKTSLSYLAARWLRPVVIQDSSFWLISEDVCSFWHPECSCHTGCKPKHTLSNWSWIKARHEVIIIR